MANFARGGKDAKEVAKEQAARSGFKKTNYLRNYLAEDGNSVVIRLIDENDEWIWIHQHGMVPTKGAPEDFKSESGKSWPKTMGAVCRKSKTREGALVFPEYGGECYICDHMTNPKNKKGKYFPSIRVWARAVLREEIKGTEDMVKSEANPDGIEPWEVGKTVGYCDAEVEVEELDKDGKPTGNTKMEKDVVVLNYGMGNFFGKLQAYGEAYGTVRDRDYKVVREGGGLETDYQIIALDKIYNEGGVVHTLEDEKVLAPYLKVVDLEAEIENQASDDYYDRFFDARHPFPTRNGSDDEEQAEKPAAKAKSSASVQRPVPKPEPEPGDQESDAPEPDSEGDGPAASATASRMEAMRARLKNQKAETAAAAD